MASPPVDPNPSAPLPRISDAEWKVMHVAWALGPATLREIVDRLARDRDTDWKPRTIQTLVRRLVDKGALKAEPVEGSGREFRYQAAISRAQCQREESRSFLGRVFDGQLTPFIAGMVESEKISAAELDELRALLNRAAADQQQPDPSSKANSTPKSS